MATNRATPNATDREKEFEKLKTEIRSILITAKGGSSVRDLERDFEDLNGYPMPTRKLGFQNVQELINSMPDVVKVSHSGGQIWLFAKSNEATRRIEKLIEKQRPSKVSRFGGTEAVKPTAERCRQTAERRGVIQQRVMEILSRSDGPITYTQFRRLYGTTYMEPFDPKMEFNSSAKAVFIGKFRCVVSSSGSSSDFLISLKGGSGPRYGGTYPTRQSVPPSRGRGEYTYPYYQPHYQQQKENLPPRFRSASASNRAAGRFQRTEPASDSQFAARAFSAAQPKPISTASKSTTAPVVQPPLKPPQSTVSKNEPLSSRPQPNSASAWSPSTITLPKPAVVIKEKTSGNVKTDLVRLLSKYPCGVEMSLLRDAFINMFNKDIDVGYEQLQNSCADICDFIRSEGRCFVRPKRPSPLSNMAEVAAALPPISLDNLIERCKQVLRAHPSGVSYLLFHKAYRAVIGTELDPDLASNDFLSLSELIDSRNDVFTVKKMANGETILSEANSKRVSARSRSVTLVEKDPADTVSEEALMDRLWFLAMNAPDRCLLVTEARKAYKAAFGSSLPVNAEAWNEYCLKLFDYIDRFDLTYEGVLQIIAYAGYKPSDPLVVQMCSRKSSVVRNGVGSSSDFISTGEVFKFQPWPLTVAQLHCLSQDNSARRVQVLMAQVEKPSRFYIQLKSMQDELENLISEMQHYYSNNANAARVPPRAVCAELVCACQYEGDQLWCRGLVMTVEDDNAVVFLVDYGTEIIVSSRGIYYLSRQFFELPAQAILCGLALLLPTGEKWSIEAGDILANMCGSSVLEAEIYDTVNDVSRVFLTATTTNGDVICINDTFLDQHLAVYDESVQQGADGADSEAELQNANVESEIVLQTQESSSGTSFKTADDELKSPVAQSGFEDFQSTDSPTDLSFEMEVVGQLKECMLQDPSDLKVVSLARTVLGRKRLAFMKMLSEGGEDSVVAVFDKLTWLEEQIAWLIELEQGFRGIQ